MNKKNKKEEIEGVVYFHDSLGMEEKEAPIIPKEHFNKRTNNLLT